MRAERPKAKVDQKFKAKTGRGGTYWEREPKKKENVKVLLTVPTKVFEILENVCQENECVQHLLYRTIDKLAGTTKGLKK